MKEFAIKAESADRGVVPDKAKMGKQNRRRGYEAEGKCHEALLAEDCVVAVRTAGSHSPFDCIGIREDGSMRLVQVKRVRKDPKVAFRKAYKEIAVIPRNPVITLEVWVWLDGKGWVMKERID